MWVYDGEEWTRDEGGVEPSSTSNTETTRPQWPAEMVPELQIVEVEIVQPVPRNRYVPQVPLP
jgi:hypothetical protein